MWGYKGLSCSCVLGRYPSVYGETRAFFTVSQIVLKGRKRIQPTSPDERLCTSMRRTHTHHSTRAWFSLTLHIHCIQVCLHCFAHFEACAEWGWRSGGDNYNTSATPSRELSSAQISELSLELVVLQTTYRTRPLASGIATTRIGTQKKRFQVKHSFKASHIIINISVQVVIVGWTLHK